MILTSAKKFLASLEYEHRYMISLIIAELFFIGMIYFLPKMEFEKKDIQFYQSEELVFVEEIINTRQNSGPAAPPKPQVPVPVPNDQVVDEEIEFPEFEDFISEEPIQSEEDGTGFSGEGEMVESPDQPPSVLRIVEPTIPDAAKQANLKAEVIVTFLVDTKGNVEEVIYSEIRIYNGNQYEVADDIRYRVLEAISVAAFKWRFRPASHQGTPVKTYVKNSFRIGF